MQWQDTPHKHAGMLSRDQWLFAYICVTMNIFNKMKNFTLFPELRLALLHSGHNHVTRACCWQTVQATLYSLHSNYIQVLGTCNNEMFTVIMAMLQSILWFPQHCHNLLITNIFQIIIHTILFTTVLPLNIPGDSNPHLTHKTTDFAIMIINTPESAILNRPYHWASLELYCINCFMARFFIHTWCKSFWSM